MSKKLKRFRKKNFVRNRAENIVTKDDAEKQNIVEQRSMNIVSSQSCGASPYAMIYKSELDFVSRCILDYTNIETGGQMFGYWTDEGTPVVLYTIGPGLHANHQPTFFNQDMAYLKSIGQLLTKKYGLQHIGEWHSHHQLGLAHPSGHDASTMANGLVTSRRNRFLLCIGNCTPTTTRLNPFNFDKVSGVHYNESQWIVNPLDSPFRALIDSELRELLCMPRTSAPNYIGMNQYATIAANAKVKYESTYWLSDKSNNLVLKSIVDFLKTDEKVSNLKVLLDQESYVHISCLWYQKMQVAIFFSLGFPQIPPRISVYGSNLMGMTKQLELLLPEWNFDSDILNTFVKYYKKIELL